jgi:ABC-type multidrug transport system ATPase subunit
MLSDVEALCDHVGIIMGGTLIKTGSLGELLKEIHTDYEMHVEGAPEEVKQAVREMRAEMEHRAGYVVLKFDEDIRRGVIEAVAKTRAEIISLHPVRRSLEGLFVEEAKKESPPREGAGG